MPKYVHPETSDVSIRGELAICLSEQAGKNEDMERINAKVLGYSYLM